MAVCDGAGDVPGTEHGTDGLPKLIERILREIVFRMFAVDLREAFDEALQILRAQVGVFLGAALLFEVFQGMFEDFAVDAHDNVAEHADEAAVRIQTQAFVAGLANQPTDGLFVEAQVQDGIHHAGHRHGRTAAYAEQQWVFRIAELRAHRFFDLLDGPHDLRLNLRGKGAILLGIFFARRD